MQSYTMRPVINSRGLNPVRLLLALPLAALMIASCSTSGARSATAPVASPHPTTTTRPSTTKPATVVLAQMAGGAPTRMLRVDPSGTWKCSNCAGDGKQHDGRLNPDQASRLQELAHDPALERETDLVRGYRLPCREGLVSTVQIERVLVTSTDCAGDQRPPVAAEILRLLTDATPAEATRPGVPS
ncbi:hypothetical protein GA0070624_3442 [Micromonospora rhizosphaerae]|uniref:Lipoprotein n=1 Tax=Micromonospora rhizosphaerae TaxID=568872 RepID=A0A1C6SCG1_9ACTN|nr:hypothetical protein GA0070624_3442 [Micromonospora rhizosphaerae]